MVNSPRVEGAVTSRAPSGLVWVHQCDLACLSFKPVQLPTISQCSSSTLTCTTASLVLLSLMHVRIICALSLDYIYPKWASEKVLMTPEDCQSSHLSAVVPASPVQAPARVQSGGSRIFEVPQATSVIWPLCHINSFWPNVFIFSSGAACHGHRRQGS